jgi:hypothetical protein
MASTVLEPTATDTLALGHAGHRGGVVSARVNARIAGARDRGIRRWADMLGRPLTELEEDAVVILADGLARRNDEQEPA